MEPMTATSGTGPASPSLADQVSRLYDLIAGYHLTNLIEVARQVGAWERIAARPGIDSTKLAAELGTDPGYTDALCRTAFAFELIERHGDGWRMAPHMDAILGDPDSAFYLGRAARVHLILGNEDYPDMAARIRDGRVMPYQDHSDALIQEVADGLRSLPRIFIDLVLPRLPSLGERLAAGARVLDLGCGAGWAIVELAQRFPASRVDGVDIEPRSVRLAQERIDRRGLSDRCSARLLGAEGLTDEDGYDVITMFLVVHEIRPEIKDDVIAAAARALVPGGSLVLFDEAYPDTDQAFRTMPSRFAAVAQWFELTWGNTIDTAAELRARCARANLRIADETTFSRFAILVAERPMEPA
jgi:SAM-dependent methyltransferase